MGRSGPSFLLAATLVGLLAAPAWAEEPGRPNTGALSLAINLNFPTSYYALNAAGGKDFKVWGITGFRIEY